MDAVPAVCALRERRARICMSTRPGGGLWCEVAEGLGRGPIREYVLR